MLSAGGGSIAIMSSSAGQAEMLHTHSSFKSNVVDPDPIGSGTIPGSGSRIIVLDPETKKNEKADKNFILNLGLL